MTKYTVFTLLLLLVKFGIAQTTVTTYHKDKWSIKEVSVKKAKFMRTMHTALDSTVTTEIREYPSNKLVYKNALKGYEPKGVWLQRNGDESLWFDYDFELVYRTDSCPINHALPQGMEVFEDKDSLKYKAPQVAGFTGSMVDYLVKNLQYIDIAKENNIEGRLVLSFSINEQGELEDLHLTKSAHVLLDKESMRLFHAIKFSSPATLNGQPIRICVKFPLSYTIAN